jgi:ATP-binding cassette subfamily B protein
VQIGLTGKIDINNLSFGYADEPVIRNLSLQIPKGMRLGIIGPVGSGKTTLIRVLARLYPVSEGMIYYDGIDINSYPLDDLRESIGYVQQDPFLFSRSVTANIAFGKEGAKQHEIENASSMACLAGDVERFPNAYETMVGERGITLSGGQKQRASIARAILKNSPILIFDDPFSAVDTKTEENIIANLSSVYHDKTVIIVSHRMSSLRDCDMIISLDKGRIVEKGTPSELMELDGYYAQVCRDQELKKEIEAL